MNDRQTFQVMPSLATDTGRDARALPFHHANEVARPHYYGVTFDNGIKGEIAPTDHAALLRFSFPGGDADADLRQRRRRHREPDDRPRDELDQRRDGHQRRQRRDADVRLRDVRPPDDRERHHARPHGLGEVQRLDGDDADRDLADLTRAGAAQPDARGRAVRRLRRRARASAARVGPQALGDRGRGRDRRPAHDAVLEPLPAQPLSQLGLRAHAVGRRPHGPVAARARRRSCPARSTSTTASGTRTARRGRRTRCSIRGRRASSWTASSSSTATRAGSRAGPRPARRT